MWRGDFCMARKHGARRRRDRAVLRAMVFELMRGQRNY